MCKSVRRKSLLVSVEPLPRHSPPSLPSSLGRAVVGETEARSGEGKWLSQVWTPRGVPGASQVAPTASTRITAASLRPAKARGHPTAPKTFGTGSWLPPGDKLGRLRSRLLGNTSCQKLPGTGDAGRGLNPVVRDLTEGSGSSDQGAGARLLSARPAVASFLGHLRQGTDMEGGRNGPCWGQIGAGWGV